MKTVVAMREAPAPETLFAAAPEDAGAAAKTRAATRPTRSAFLPLLLVLLAVTLWLGLQVGLQLQERQQLQMAGAALQPSVDQSATLRQSLDRLASDTQVLANAGNGNARALVDELRRRGVTINPPASGVTINPSASGAAPAPTPRP